MRGEAGIVNFLDSWMLGQEVCNGACILFMLAHPHGQGFNATQREPCVEGCRDTTGCILIELDVLIYLCIVHDQRTTDNIAVAVDVFGCAMDDDVGPQMKRLLKVGAGEGVVNDN